MQTLQMVRPAGALRVATALLQSDRPALPYPLPVSVTQVRAGVSEGVWLTGLWHSWQRRGSQPLHIVL